MKNKISKFITITLVSLAFLYFTNDFGLIDIEKTSIVVALGIDAYSEKEYLVTAQIATPESSAEMTVKNQKKTVTGKGATVAEAIENIGATTGWYPMLSFCELVIIGEPILNENVMDVITYFIRSDAIPDSAILVASENTAKEILDSTPILEDLTALSLEKIVTDTQKSKLIAMSNVKQFAEDYYSKSACSYMPKIKKTEVENSDNSSEGNGKDKRNLYDATTTCVFSQGVYKFDLTKEETLVYNILKKGFENIRFVLSDVEYDGKKCGATLVVKKIKTAEKIKFDGGILYLPSIDISFNVEDFSVSADKSTLIPYEIIPQNVLKKAEEKISSALTSIFDKCLACDCDLFKLKESIYKYHYDKYELYKDGVLSSAILKTDVKCTSYVKNRV